MNTTGKAAVNDALTVFVSMVSKTGPGPWNHMTCFEAEVVANLLEAVGEPELAEFVISDHADGDDDPDDDHHDKWRELNGDDT